MSPTKTQRHSPTSCMRLDFNNMYAMLHIKPDTPLILWSPGKMDILYLKPHVSQDYRPITRLSSVQLISHFNSVPRNWSMSEGEGYKLDQFRADLCQSLSVLTSVSCPSELAVQVNTVLQDLMDNHAPEKTIQVSLRPFAPWYDSGGSRGGGVRGFKPPPLGCQKKKYINVHRKTPS